MPFTKVNVKEEIQKLKNFLDNMVFLPYYIYIKYMSEEFI